MSDVPLQAAGRRPAFFDDPGLDQLVSIVLELASELWVVRERLYALEAVAGDQGLALRQAIEAWKPSAEQRTELADMRRRMLEEMFRTLGKEHRPVDPATADVARAD